MHRSHRIRATIGLMTVMVTAGVPAAAQGWEISLRGGVGFGHASRQGVSNPVRAGLDVGAEVARPLGGSFRLGIGAGLTQKRFAHHYVIQFGTGTGSAGPNQEISNTFEYDFSYLALSLALEWHTGARLLGPRHLTFGIGPSIGWMSGCEWASVVAGGPCFDRFFGPSYRVRRLDYSGVLSIAAVPGRRGLGFGTRITQSIRSPTELLIYRVTGTENALALHPRTIGVFLSYAL